jgi:hypothetical protein
MDSMSPAVQRVRVSAASRAARHAARRTDGAAELDDAHVRLAFAAVDGDARDARQPVLHHVRDMGHHLHGLAQVLALALLLDHGLPSVSCAV